MNKSWGVEPGNETVLNELDNGRSHHPHASGQKMEFQSVLIFPLPRAALLTGRFHPRSGIYPGVFDPDSIGGTESGKSSIWVVVVTCHKAHAVVSLGSFPSLHASLVPRFLRQLLLASFPGLHASL